MKILVAGENQLTLPVVKEAVADVESQVIPAPSMSLALFLAQKNFPDLILANFVMTDGDGLEFLKEVKADDELHSIPFVFVTEGEVSSQVRENALQLGAENVITHPINCEQLRREILPYINIRLAEKSEREPQTPE